MIGRSKQLSRRETPAATAPASGPASSPASSPASGHRTTLAELGGWRMLLQNPGLVIQALRQGVAIGDDPFGNRYFEEKRITRPTGRKRRWVVFAQRRREASLVPPEWHAWLHYTTDAPIAAAVMPWQKPYLPNLTGTPAAYRPPGHDYESGAEPQRQVAYEAWTPDS